MAGLWTLLGLALVSQAFRSVVFHFSNARCGGRVGTDHLPEGQSWFWSPTVVRSSR